MKHNRSLKDLYISKHNFKEQENAETIFSPRDFKPTDTHHASTTSYDSNKFIKSCQSQKNLFKAGQLNITSPKYLVPSKESYQAVLTPANKNLPVQ